MRSSHHSRTAVAVLAALSLAVALPASAGAQYGDLDPGYTGQDPNAPGGPGAGDAAAPLMGFGLVPRSMRLMARYGRLALRARVSEPVIMRLTFAIGPFRQSRIMLFVRSRQRWALFRLPRVLRIALYRRSLVRPLPFVRIRVLGIAADAAGNRGRRYGAARLPR